MFDAVLSNNGKNVVLFHEDGGVEEMGVYEFTVAYGTEILESAGEARTSETTTSEMTTEPSADDVEQYWKAFRRLVENCGRYAHKVGLQRNVADGVLKAQKVAYKYFGGANSDRELAYEIVALDGLRMAAIVNLDFWSKRLGFKPMSTPDDMKRYHLDGRADTVILLDYLSNADFRKRMYYRIDKYTKKGVVKSITEVVLEILASYKKKSRQPS